MSKGDPSRTSGLWFPEVDLPQGATAAQIEAYLRRRETEFRRWITRLEQRLTELETSHETDT